MRLTRGSRISGTVVDAQGRSRAGVRVAVLGECGKIFHSTTVLSGAGGAFAMDSAPTCGGVLAALDEQGTICGMQSCADANDLTIRISQENSR